MPSIQILFNGTIRETIELINEETTVGRKDTNDIRLNNPGVSGIHAKIIREGEDYYIVDGHSTNGTYVNGERISQKQLSYGDVITIFKHSLKFSALSAFHERPSSKERSTPSAPQDGTVAVDVSYLSEVLKQQSQTGSAFLLVNEQGRQQTKQPITSTIFKMGRGRECNLRIDGWLTPHLAAILKHKANGFYLIPGKRGKVSVNGSRVAVETKLKDGDNLDIGKMSCIFYHARVAAPTAES